MAGIEIRHVRPLAINGVLAKQLHNVGWEAWKDAYGGTWSGEYIRRRFDTRGFGMLERAVENFQIIAQVGSLSVALATSRDGGRTPVGYSAAYNELSMQPITRLKDRLKHPLKHAHVLLAELNVLPEFQGYGIGRRLVSDAYKMYDARKIPTAWVFEESVAAQGLLRQLGFEINPPNQEATKRQSLGPLAPMTSEYHMMAPSVAAVRAAARATD